MMLVVENLSQSYSENNPVLDNVSFAIAPGTFTAILGRSGAGKTTLLRSILRLHQPQKGRVWFNHCDLLTCSSRELQKQRRNIATIAQQFNLIPRRTALENCLGGRLNEIALWRCFLSRFPLQLQREGLTALARVNLLEMAFQRADRLSGGQQQRVAIARALTQNACLILADEPVASLDPQSAHQVLSLLRSLCDREHLTVVCNLHQVEFACQYSDRILGLNQGKLMLDRPPSELKSSDFQQIYQ
ncbi:MAG: phosphonate ABC transporter ATP-binding protein [Spirulinaceae cyanobacterium]